MPEKLFPTSAAIGLRRIRPSCMITSTGHQRADRRSLLRLAIATTAVLLVSTAAYLSSSAVGASQQLSDPAPELRNENAGGPPYFRCDGRRLKFESIYCNKSAGMYYHEASSSGCDWFGAGACFECCGLPAPFPPSPPPPSPPLRANLWGDYQNKNYGIKYAKKGANTSWSFAMANPIRTDYERLAMDTAKEYTETVSGRPPSAPNPAPELRTDSEAGPPYFRCDGRRVKFESLFCNTTAGQNYREMSSSGCDWFGSGACYECCGVPAPFPPSPPPPSPPLLGNKWANAGVNTGILFAKKGANTGWTYATANPLHTDYKQLGTETGKEYSDQYFREAHGYLGLDDTGLIKAAADPSLTVFEGAISDTHKEAAKPSLVILYDAAVEGQRLKRLADERAEREAANRNN